MELLPDFRLLRPASVEDALAARAANPRARLLAGGTDLMPNMRRGLVDTETVIDLGGCAGLDEITADGDGLRIGATVTLAALAGDDGVARRYPALSQAAGSVAGPTQRAMATVGGNICLDTRCIFYNQSEWWRKSNDYCLKYGGDVCHVVPTSKRCYATYSGDLAAALALYDAAVEIAGSSGRRRVALDALLVDDGMDYLALGNDEMVTAALIPARFAGLAAAYRKLRIRGSIDFPLAGVAVGVGTEDGRIAALRVGITGTNPHPILIDTTDALAGADVEAAAKAIEKQVRKQVSPLRTGLVEPQYRRRAVAAMAAQMVRDLAAK